MRMPNKDSSNRLRGINPTDPRKRWLIFSSFAQSHVNASGGWGPACRPYQHVLQLQIENRLDGDESWTVYRNNEDARRDGKIVFRKWDSKTDWARFLKFKGKELPTDWHTDYTVIEREFPISSRWLKDLHRVLSGISIPPIAGHIKPFSAEPDYKLLLWRSWQESEFSWKQRPPVAWRPLASFFFSLLKKLRKHTHGYPLFSPKELG